MYRRLFMPRGTRLITKPSRLRAFVAAFCFAEYEPWKLKAYPSAAGFFFLFMTSPPNLQEQV
jgi:hypothetical protein